jgi:hypothetical protein
MYPPMSVNSGPSALQSTTISFTFYIFSCSFISYFYGHVICHRNGFKNFTYVKFFFHAVLVKSRSHAHMGASMPPLSYTISTMFSFYLLQNCF